MIGKLKAKLKENRLIYVLGVVLGIWILGFGVIFYASAHAGCEDVGIVLDKGGLCLARGLAGLSCYAGYLGLWTILGVAVAMGKGRNPIIGAIVGFTLQFVGCLGLLMLEPRRDLTGRMIGWDEYKHYTKEQREAIKPKPVPKTPEMKRRIKLVIAFSIAMVILMVLQVLKNLGKI